MVESSELATALAVGSPDAHNSIPGFLLKLRVLVEDEGIDDIIHWGPGGITFIITNPVAFAEEILPIYFKHNHLASFIRQLNLYGFHKVTGVSDGGLVKTERECLEFRHPYFLRDKPEFLRMIKRKPATQHTAKTEEKVELGVKDIASQVPAIMSIASSVQQVMAKQAETDKKMATLKSENEVLWREVASLHRKNMQQSQMVDKIVRFLVKLVQRPHKGRNAPVTPATAGRPIPLMIDRPSTSGKDSTGKPRTLSGLGLDSGSRTDHSPSGPVIHDVTELLRTSDGVTSLNSGDHKSVPSAGGATHVVQVMPTYISVPSPGDPHIVCAPSSVGSTSERAPSISATTSVEPEVSMPMSVAPVEAILGDENVLILDPNTLTLHPAPQLSYVLDGKKVNFLASASPDRLCWIILRERAPPVIEIFTCAQIIVNPDGTQSVVALEGNCGENQPAEGTSYIISDPTTMSISTSPCTSSPSTNATTVTSAGKSSGKQFPGKGRGKSVAGRKRTSIGEGEDVPQQKRSLYNENELRVAVPSNPFTFPSFVDTPTSSSSQQSGYVQNPVAETQLSSQFDVDKFLEYLTSSDAHFDVNELYKIVSDPAIVSKVTELDAASAASSKQQPLPVTSGSTPSSPVRDINVQAAQASSMTSVASAAKVLPDLSELMDEGDTHESYYKGLEQNEFQTLDTPLVDGLD